MKANHLGLFLVVCALLCRCGSPAPAPEPSPPAAAPSPPAAAPAPAASQAPAPEDDRPLVVFLGDSLTAGLGLDEDQAYPAHLAALLEAEGTPVGVVNAGVSGDTTAGGLRRLDWLLRQEPEVVVVALGANDGLRALDLAMTEENLRQIIVRSRDAGAGVLLAGMKVPPNYGPEYATGFEAIFPRLAAELEVALMPFLLADVAAVPELNQADGIHPNAEGQRRVAANVLPYLLPLLEGHQ